MGETENIQFAESQVTPSFKEIEKEALLKTILYLIQTEFEKRKDEADRSYELLSKIGEKTELVHFLEKAIDNPFDFLYNNISHLNKEISNVVSASVESFLKSRIGIFNKVYRQDSENTLIYCLELKSDNQESRNKVFNFLDYYEKTKLSKIYPVNFYFVPKEMTSELLEVNEVKFA